MPHHRASTVIAAATAAAITLAGCAHRPAPTLPAEAPATSATPTSTVRPDAALPAPDALADVLYRIADPALPGADKLVLIESATPADTADLEKFTTALRDSGYLPLTFEVTNVGRSDRNPGNATANVNITTHSPDSGQFTFPMEFTSHADGWQLSRQTAELLLAFGAARTDAAPNATPTP